MKLDFLAEMFFFAVLSLLNGNIGAKKLAGRNAEAKMPAVPLEIPSDVSMQKKASSRYLTLRENAPKSILTK